MRADQLARRSSAGWRQRRSASAGSITTCAAFFAQPGTSVTAVAPAADDDDALALVSMSSLQACGWTIRPAEALEACELRGVAPS